VRAGADENRGQGALVLLLALLLLLALADPAVATAKKKGAQRTTDPLASRQWSLDAIDGRDPLTRFRRRPAEVTIAVIDTGVNLAHPDLRSRLWRNPGVVAGPTPRGGRSAALYPQQGPVPAGAPGWDTIGSASAPFASPDPDPEDVGGHGTMVAGIAAAATENREGIAAVAANARVIALRSCWAENLNCADELAAASIRWAVARGARVVNLSWLARSGHDQIAAAIAENEQAVFVAAAGNSALNVDREADAQPCETPAPNLICVAASGRDNALASCSNHGGVGVDVAAPGIDLPVTVTVPEGTYARGTPCATSTAAPHVSGLAALLFGAVPEASAGDVRAAILAGARPSPALAGRVATGGVIDVRRSLRRLQRAFGIPRPPQTKAPPPEVTGRRAVFDLSASKARGRGFECSLDGGAFRRCSRRAGFGGLKAGRHVLEARALGRRGTLDPTPATRGFRIKRGR
jgi:subtilisin family serine protease